MYPEDWVKAQVAEWEKFQSLIRQGVAVSVFGNKLVECKRGFQSLIRQGVDVSEPASVLAMG